MVAAAPPKLVLLNGSAQLDQDAQRRGRAMGWSFSRATKATNIVRTIGRASYVSGDARRGTRLYQRSMAREAFGLEGSERATDSQLRSVRRWIRDAKELGYVTTHQERRGQAALHRLTDLAINLLDKGKQEPRQRGARTKNPSHGLQSEDNPVLGLGQSGPTIGKDAREGVLLSSREGGQAPRPDEGKPSGDHEPKASQPTGSKPKQPELPLGVRSSREGGTPEGAEDLDPTPGSPPHGAVQDPEPVKVPEGWPPEQSQERASNQSKPPAGSEAPSQAKQVEPLPRDFGVILGAIRCHYRDRHGIQAQTRLRRNGPSPKRFAGILAKQARRVLDDPGGVDAGFAAESTRMERALRRYPHDTGDTSGWIQTAIFSKPEDAPADLASITVPKGASTAEALWLRHVKARGVFDDAKDAIVARIEAALRYVVGRVEVLDHDWTGQRFRSDPGVYVAEAIERTWEKAEVEAERLDQAPAARFRYAMDRKPGASEPDSFEREKEWAAQRARSEFTKRRREAEAA